MELRHIRYFVAVAEELNFTRAAARLGIGQPPLSQQIKDLEVELGVMLLRRVPRGAELTQAGMIFLEEGRQALAAAEKAAAAAKQAARGERGLLRLGFTNSAHFHAIVPSVIRDFTRRYPDLEVQITELDTPHLLDQLTAGKIDVAFSRASLDDDPRFGTAPVDEELLVAALPWNHRCSNGASVNLTALKHETFVLKLRQAGPEVHNAVLLACRRAGFEPQIGQEAPQLASVVSFVAAGLGVSLVPSSMQQITAPGIRFIPLEGTLASVRLSLVWRRLERSKTVRNFVSLTREQVSAPGAA